MKKIMCIIFSFLYSSSVFSSESNPNVFTIGELKKNSFSYDLGIQYHTLSSSSSGLFEDVVKVGNDFVSILRFSKEGEINIDSIIISPKITYSIGEGFSIFSSLNSVSTNRRILTPSGATDSSDNYISDVSFGINYRTELHSPKYDIHNTYLSVYLSTSIAQFDSISSQSLEFKLGQSFTMGVGITKIVDSIILLHLNATYKYAGVRKVEGINYDFPDTMSITPSIQFVVTPKITLNSSFTWQKSKPTIINGDKTRDISRTSLIVGTGLDYKMTKNLLASIGLSSNISGNDGASINLNFHYH